MKRYIPGIFSTVISYGIITPASVLAHSGQSTGDHVHSFIQGEHVMTLLTIFVALVVHKVVKKLL